MYLKTVFVILITIDLCNSNAIQKLNRYNCKDCNCRHPKDNSHYSRKISQCVFFPDGEKKLVMENLRRLTDPKGMTFPIEKYLYYTKHASGTMVHDEASISLALSSIEKTGSIRGPIFVIIHGFRSKSTNSWITRLKEKILNIIIPSDGASRYKRNSDQQIIIVPDWSQGAARPITNSFANAKAVGEQLGEFLHMFVKIVACSCNKGSKSNSTIHLVGANLGAHVATYAARNLRGTASITALDPTGPLWFKKPEILLNENDAACVTHFVTDAYMLGLPEPLGRSNIYFSKGKHPQPRCLTSACSHQRAIEYYTVLWEFPIEITECDDYKSALNGQCSGKRKNYTIFKCPAGVFSARMDPMLVMLLYGE